MLRSELQLGDRYRLAEQVATGGMGEVWRATDVILDRQVAVKVLLPSLSADPGFLARFRAEARMMAALRHPGIVQVYDCGEADLPDGGRVDYLVMEYVDGEPLSRRIAADGRLDVVGTLSVVAQAAEALHAAHQAGIVHRDVKPSNLLIQPDGTVVLVDFGVARSVANTSITSTNAVPGTALYMAPEQAAGRPVSAATDIYALGAVAYHCLTGGPPFTAENALQVAVRHLHDDLPPLPADLPEPVIALVNRALAKDPEERFPDAQAMALAARTAAGEPLPGTDVRPLTPIGSAAVRPSVGGAEPGTLNDLPAVGEMPAAQEPARRSPVALAGAAVAALLITTGLVAVLAFSRADDTPAKNQPVTSPSTAVPTESRPARSDGPDRVVVNRTGGPSTFPSVRATGTPSAGPEPTGDIPGPGTTAEPTPPEPPAPTDPPTSDPPASTSSPQATGAGPGGSAGG